MNNNSSKQILLSVIGVAILVVAVVGVSFAFFTYTRTGSSNNTISTGSIVFTFADSNAIHLTNHFPISTADGVLLSGADKTCTFTITGNTTVGNAISYSVWMVPGDTDADETKQRFADTQVYTNIQATIDSEVEEKISFTPAMAANAGSSIDALEHGTGDFTNRRLLGTGTLTGTSSVSATFTVRMWVDESIVSIGEGGTYTSDEYSKLYYSSKIVVTANA